jgi:hypothetical protein
MMFLQKLSTGRVALLIEEIREIWGVRVNGSEIASLFLKEPLLESYPCVLPAFRTIIEPLRMVVSNFKLVSFHLFFLIFTLSECVAPGAGVILVIVTGPITHQSPVRNWPVFTGLSNVHVIPYWLTLARFAIFTG